MSARHCEEQSDEAIQSLTRDSGLLRFARNDGVRTEPSNNRLGLWAPAFAGATAERLRLGDGQAVTATGASSSTSSSIGANVESGLVESVMGLRPPSDGLTLAAGSRDCA